MNSRTRGPARPPTGWLVVVGAAAGLVTWLYDYDFFLNAAGPETPMCNAILRATGTAGAPPWAIVLWPAVVLVLLGMTGGFLASSMFVVFRRPSTK
jgi:hypothetical protein